MRHLYFTLTGGVILIIIVFAFIAKQNAVLIKEDKSKGYNNYNWKTSTPQAIRDYWAQSKERTGAVTRIVYLDYLLMFLYGLLIAYSLYFLTQQQPAAWLKYLLWLGIVVIISGVICDAIQDNAIYTHLTKNKFTDVRCLTQFKFSCIILSVIALITGLVCKSKLLCLLVF